jgi:hypothetical protein
MWVLENPELVFFSVQHAPIDLNSRTQDDIPLTLGIQTPWQLEILQNLGMAIQYVARFGTNQSKVHHFCYCMKFPILYIKSFVASVCL